MRTWSDLLRVVTAFLAAATILAPRGLVADEASASLPAGDEVARKVATAAVGDRTTQTVTMELVDSRGQTRTQKAKVFRKDYPGERKFVLFFDEPANVKGTAFLTYDYGEAGKPDDQWLYLPALRKVRRVSASERGGYFLGTDLTYDDMKNSLGLAVEDYTWKTLRTETVDGHACYVVEGTPATAEIARELGYGRVLNWVDGQIWRRRKFEAWDVNGNPLKIVELKEIEQVDGVWTPIRLEARNLKTGHSTRITLSEVSYQSAVDDDIFTERALRRGL